MPEDIALFIDFENIRYSMLNIQRREPDPQELIAVARRYGTVMVARAYADWSRQPEPFKGSLTAAMIDRVDCPAKQRDRIRMGTIHYAGNPSTGTLQGGDQPGGQAQRPYDQPTGSFQRPWPGGSLSNSGPLPAITPGGLANGLSAYQDASLPYASPLPPSSFELEQQELDENLLPESDEPSTDEGYGIADYPQREPRYANVYGQPAPTGGQAQGTAPTGQSSSTGPLAYPTVHTGNTGHLPAVGAGGSSTIVQSTVVQSTVDLNMLMDIIETVFDRPTISTFVLMTGDKDFTRISARLKLRLNKTVIVVGIPGTVSRDLISSASQFVPLVPGGSPAPMTANGGFGSMASSGNTGAMPAISANAPTPPYQQYGLASAGAPLTMDVLDPQFLQFLDYIDRNWSWRTIIGVSNFIGDPVNPKNRFRGRLTRESARELLNACLQQNILILQTDSTGAEDLRLNRAHPGVDEVLKQFVR